VIEVAQQIVATTGRPADAVEIAERAGLDDNAVQPTLRSLRRKGLLVEELGGHDRVDSVALPQPTATRSGAAERALSGSLSGQRHTAFGRAVTAALQWRTR
jgi:hypothetical protein